MLVTHLKEFVDESSKKLGNSDQKLSILGNANAADEDKVIKITISMLSVFIEKTIKNIRFVDLPICTYCNDFTECRAIYHAERGVLLINNSLISSDDPHDSSGSIDGHRYYLLRDGSILDLLVSGQYYLGMEEYKTLEEKRISIEEMIALNHEEYDIHRIIKSIQFAFDRAIERQESKKNVIGRRIDMVNSLMTVVDQFQTRS